MSKWPCDKTITSVNVKSVLSIIYGITSPSAQNAVANGMKTLANTLKNNYADDVELYWRTSQYYDHKSVKMDDLKKS